MADRCLTEVDHPDRATPLLLDALDGYDTRHVRYVALYRSWLGEAHAEAGDVDRARAETLQVLDAVQPVNSARGGRTRPCLAPCTAPYADVPVVREVEERSQAVKKAT